MVPGDTLRVPPGTALNKMQTGTVLRLIGAVAVGSGLAAMLLFSALALPLPSPGHTTAADFAAGTLTHTQVISVGDGALVLAAVGVTPPWRTEAALPTGRADVAVVAAGESLYAIGGVTPDFNATATIARATLNGGSLTPWEVDTVTLPAPLFGIAATAVESPTLGGSALYVVGGYSLETFLSVDTVTRLTVDATGAISERQPLATLPRPLHYVQIARSGADLYVLGGINHTTFISDVFHARIETDGRLTGWQSARGLPEPRASGRAATFVAADGTRWLAVAGGQRDATTLHQSVHVAPIAADGTLGNWRMAASLPTPLAFHGLEAASGQFWLTGGQANQPNTGPISRAQPSALPDAPGWKTWAGGSGPWVSGSALPAPRWRHGSALLGGRLWVVGGQQTTGASAQPLASVFSGRTTGLSAGTWPHGTFGHSLTLDGRPPVGLVITTSITNSAMATLSLAYRIVPGGAWHHRDSAGAPLVAASPQSPDLATPRVITYTVAPAGPAERFEYRLFFTTTQPGVTAAFHGLQLILPENYRLFLPILIK